MWTSQWLKMAIQDTTSLSSFLIPRILQLVWGISHLSYFIFLDPLFDLSFLFFTNFMDHGQSPLHPSFWFHVLPVLPVALHSLPIVRVANSKPELSQLLFISIRQRELVKSSRWIWSIYLYRFYLVCALVSHTTMWPCDSWPVTSHVTWCDVTPYLTCDITPVWHPFLCFCEVIQKEKKRKRKGK